MGKEDDLLVDLKAGFGFDPEWDTEQAFQAGAEGPFSPFHRWAAWKQLEKYWEAFNAGDKQSIFAALRTCACHSLPMPNWLADAYCLGHDEWVNYRKATLDEAFDVKMPKGKHLNKLSKVRKLRVSVALLVKELHSKGQPIDQNLFDVVGKQLGVSGSTARDMYYNKG